MRGPFSQEPKMRVVGLHVQTGTEGMAILATTEDNKIHCLDLNKDQILLLLKEIVTRLFNYFDIVLR